VRYGTAFVLIAVGAILAYAITWSPNGIDLQTTGEIVMLAGVLGLLISLLLDLGIAERRRRPPAAAAPPPPRERERRFEPVMERTDPHERRTRVVPRR
jgi:hypothetical protein